MKIAIAQINCTVGDLAGNVARILDFAARARAQSVDLLITPELALCGYPPEDLLLRDDFYRRLRRALAAAGGRDRRHHASSSATRTRSTASAITRLR